jgi:HSP20 family protein
MALSIRGNRGGRQLQRYDPFDDLLSPFDTFPFGTLARYGVDNAMTTTTRPFAPILSADLIESDNEFKIHADLPGVNKEDLDISFNEGQMTIKAERKEVHEENTDQVHRYERSFGKVQRTMTIPRNADMEKAQACLKDGVLTIVFPKLENKTPNKLQIS